MGENRPSLRNHVIGTVYVMSEPSFGRRPQAAPLPVMRKTIRPAPVLAPPAATLSVDDEIRQWKKSRGFSRHLRPVALTASLCFGIASLVLPKTVNDEVQYPLYALSAASLYAGLRRKR
jgi:hypothetical protein